MDSPESFTEILQRHRAGEDVALDRLLPVIYDELRVLARRHMRSAQDAHTLEPTALVNEVYLRMVDQRLAAVADRAHFRSLCARVMRRLLVEHARARNAERRGGGRVVPLQTAAELAGGDQPAVDLLALDEALEQLARLDERKARVVELRVFAGLGVVEVAEILEVSERTVEADWFFARAWLRGRLDRG